MKYNYPVLLIVCFFTASGFLLAENREKASWFKDGYLSAYEVGNDTDIVYKGGKSGYIKSRQQDSGGGYGRLLQYLSAAKYTNKRVKFSAYIKTDNVMDWTGLYMRVSSYSKNLPLSYDDMENRKIKDKTDWKEYSIVLDIPADAYLIIFGVQLTGRGQVWIDNARIEVVNSSLPTTDMLKNLPLDEANMDMEGYIDDNTPVINIK